MQLFTIGLAELNPDGTNKLDADSKPLETYSQEDVTNLARVFTGYGLDYLLQSAAPTPVSPGPKNPFRARISPAIACGSTRRTIPASR